mmetsp:Transcript_24301/g.63786  ORF Transcript_24301/g.63786 Transcript_24301/m.63786 type:complete len:530 (+) Transcript_24301:1424-3013(+)
MEHIFLGVIQKSTEGGQHAVFQQQLVPERRILNSSEEATKSATSRHAHHEGLIRFQSAGRCLKQPRHVALGHGTDSVAQSSENSESASAQKFWSWIRDQLCSRGEHRGRKSTQISLLQGTRGSVCCHEGEEKEPQFRKFPVSRLAMFKQLAHDACDRLCRLALVVSDQLADETLAREAHDATSHVLVILMCQEFVRILPPRSHLCLRDLHEGHQQLQDATGLTLQQGPQLGPHQHGLEELHELGHELCGSVFLLAGTSIVRPDHGLRVHRLELLQHFARWSQHTLQATCHRRLQRLMPAQTRGGADGQEGTGHALLRRPAVRTLTEGRTDGQPRWQLRNDCGEGSLWHLAHDERINPSTVSRNALAPHGRWSGLRGSKLQQRLLQRPEHHRDGGRTLVEEDRDALHTTLRCVMLSASYTCPKLRVQLGPLTLLRGGQGNAHMDQDAHCLGSTHASEQFLTHTSTVALSKVHPTVCNELLQGGQRDLPHRHSLGSVGTSSCESRKSHWEPVLSPAVGQCLLSGSAHWRLL